MRNSLVFLLLALAAASLPAQDASASKSSTPVHPVVTDSHEGMTIGIDPWTQESRYKQKFPKKNPLAKGVLAIQVSFRNDNDHAVKVNLQSIRLIVQLDEDNRQQLLSMSPDDVADAVMLKNNGRDPTAKRIPIPVPLPASIPKPGRDSKWTAFRDECQNAGVPSNVVAAHSTVEGLIYFDLQGELDLLQNAHIYFPNIVSMTDNQPLSYFDITLGHGATE
jgi:hypothetical protein